jgi:hypothetical protein
MILPMEARMVGESLIGIVVSLVLLGLFGYGIYYALKKNRYNSDEDEPIERESSIAAAHEQKPGPSRDKDASQSPRERKRDRDIEL